MCMFMLLMTALCLTSCSERIDAGSPLPSDSGESKKEEKYVKKE